MERPHYAKLYKPPKDYVPPDEDKLRLDTHHPNYNSLQYRNKPINRTPRLLKYFDCFDINKNGVIILGCNELTGRIWDGYVWGFENTQTFGTENSACFKIHLNSNVTKLIYLSENIFLNCQANGCIQIWSTKPENNFQSPYSLFKIAEEKQHAGIILGMDTLSNKNFVVTGCTQRQLKIWEFGKSELILIHNMNNAHSDSITAISSCSNSESVFATCSLDRSALIWDYRQTRPAIGLYENHDIDFTTIYWGNFNEANNEMIYLGDAAGDVHIIDPKMPNKFLENIQVHTRPITKLRFCGSKMAVIGETNLIRIYDSRKDSSSDASFECIYKDSTATNFVRDALWNPLNCNELLSIGWDSKLHRHIVS